MAACGDKQGARESADAGTPGFPDVPDAGDVTTPDRVASCDQAADGTPCGDGDAQHCILNLCVDNLCGDGVRAGDEQCDDGNDMDGDACPHNCFLAPVCRDGTKDEGEECDDGNRVNDDSCSNSCRDVICGNGRTDPGEECDDKNASNSDGCSTACKTIACGNDRVDPGEVCDRMTGCSADGEACNATCSACVDDKCQKCQADKCSDWQGVDVYPGCRVAISDIAKNSGAEKLADNFIEKCSALDDCVRKNPGCFTLTNPPEMLGCFCGSVPVATCQASNTATGPCAELFGPATGVLPGETFNQDVLGRFSDQTVPAGWAYYLAQCRYENCPKECGY